MAHGKHQAITTEILSGVDYATTTACTCHRTIFHYPTLGRTPRQLLRVCILKEELVQASQLITLPILLQESNRGRSQSYSFKAILVVKRWPGDDSVQGLCQVRLQRLCIGPIRRRVCCERVHQLLVKTAANITGDRVGAAHQAAAECAGIDDVAAGEGGCAVFNLNPAIQRMPIKQRHHSVELCAAWVS